MIRLRTASAILIAAAVLFSASPDAAALGSRSFPNAATAQQRTDSSSVTITNIVPGIIPAKGDVVVSGVLHNGSRRTWRNLALLPETSINPIADAEQLAAAVGESPASVRLGDPISRLTKSMRDLLPGASIDYSIRVPRSDMSISGRPGAYWLDVVPTVDASPVSPSLVARTFLPLLPVANKKAHINVALVVPVCSNPLRTSSGALADSAAFAAELSSAGRLGRVTSFGQTADAAQQPLNWLVDPALLDTADDTAQGIASYAVGFDGVPLQPAPALPTSLNTPGSSPGSTQTQNPTATPIPSPTEAKQAAATSARLVAQSWLKSTTLLLQSSATFALPYGDPALPSLVATRHTALLTEAAALATQSMMVRGIQTQPAVAPVDGALSQSEWSALGLNETAFVGASATHSSVSATDGGRKLIVASPASDGGPGPTGQTTALGLRQRLLAEAAYVIGRATTTDLIVVLPPTWDPGSAAGASSFFSQMNRPWISFIALHAPPSGKVVLPKTTPRVTPKQRANVAAAVKLEGDARRLVDALATPAATTARLTRQLEATVLSTVSYDSASAIGRYRLNATRTVGAIDRLLDSIRVEGSDFVTLSGSSGVITVVVQNGLNQPIRMGLRQTSQAQDSTATVSPVPVTILDPGERLTIRVNLDARRVSVQEVTISAVTAGNDLIGIPLTFTLRSSPFGAVVWAITIAICLILIALMVRRLSRRTHVSWNAT